LHDKMMAEVRRPLQHADVYLESALGGHTFERFQLGDLVLQLLLDTSEARLRAMSYRDFNVAAGTWALKYPRYGRLLGFNVKMDETDAVNIHAEDVVTAKALDAGYNQISVLTVIGPTQEDHASGKHTDTLWPCGRCRGRLAESPLVNDETLIVSATPDFRTIAMGGLASVIALHDTGDDSGITTFRFPATPEVLKPRMYETGPNGMLAFPDTDATEYDESIGLHLLRRHAQLRMKE
jgi:cytidine deaminase